MLWKGKGGVGGYGLWTKGDMAVFLKIVMYHFCNSLIYAIIKHMLYRHFNPEQFFLL